MESHTSETHDDAVRSPFDVVAVVTSAGGMEAVTSLLRAFPTDLQTAVIVVQHLGQGSTLVDILSRRAPLPVSWIREDTRIRPGQVYICPPRKCLEVLPDGSCSLTPLERGVNEKPLDFFLESVADSFGTRALAVVLTGMGKDGALGARAVKNAGGLVLAQSEDTAEQPSMPRAAVESGAVDLVLPLYRMGEVIVSVVAGSPLPRPQSEIDAAEALFAGLGEVPQLLRQIDWVQTSLGPVRTWPISLRTTLRIVLESPMPMIVLWGPEHVQLYNDHYRLIMGSKHPTGLGQANRECWPEVWHLNKPIFEQVFQGSPVALENALFPITRHGMLEDTWFNLYYAPVRDERDGVAGILMTIFETTTEVLAERRLRTLHTVATRTVGTTSLRDAVARAIASLSENEQDIPFALGYVIDNTDSHAHLAAITGVGEGSPAAPPMLDLTAGHPAWPLARLVQEGKAALLNDLTTRFRGLHVGPWAETASSAILLPIRPTVDEAPAAVLILGLNPRLPFDALYRTFTELIAAQVAASLSEAQARRKERERMERLAELDRAKTVFFSNVSHEFRTPLTLMMAPLEDMLRQRDELPNGLGQEVEVALRNTRRLLTLVNTLLDFSQAEAGRLRAQFAPTDLAQLTTDIASLFRSAAERAGLNLRIDCPPLPQPVWVDREMWEKIVSNLLSNALKFTFEGEISVQLQMRPQHVELIIEDTGVGIPEAELPNLFKRFHRVQGTRSRTHDGSGIGLALVHELVRLHQGRIRVRSREGSGTLFTVWIPLGVRASRQPTPKGNTANDGTSVAASLAEQASRWTSEAAIEDAVFDTEHPKPESPLQTRLPEARVLVVDDNSDMRDYIRRLLSPHWQVETAPDGKAALVLARQNPPDLILADVMMPNMDGFELLRQLRQDEHVKTVPIILVTARAGEEAAIEGLLAGADDYIAKPFSARELVARVGAQLELARLRWHAAELNVFRVTLADTLRPLSDPLEIQQTGCRMLVEKLGAELAFFAEVDEQTEEFVIEPGYQHPGVPVVAGRIPLAAFEPLSSEHLAGRPVIVEDAQTDLRIGDEVKALLAGMRISASIGIPFMRAGKFRALLSVDQLAPRRWTDEEIALVEEVAGRVWAEVERARAETLMRQSEAKFRTLADAAPALIWHNNAHGENLFVNQHFLDFVGMSVKEIRGTGWHTLVHPDDREAYVADYLAAVREQRAWSNQTRIRRHDGEWCWFENYAQPLFAAGAFIGHVGVTVDITERKRAEADLQERERQRTFLLQLADTLYRLSDPVEIQEAVTRTTLRYFAANRCYYCEIDGDVVTIRRDASTDNLPSVANIYSLSKMPIFRTVSHAGHPIVVSNSYTTDVMDEELRQLCIQLQIIACINIPVIKNGQLVGNFCITQSTPREWTAIEVELAADTAERTWAAVERARAEDALRRSEAQLDALVRERTEALNEREERLRALVTTTAVAMWTTDANGEVVEDSPSWRAFTGQTQEERLGGGWLDAIHPDDRAYAYAQWQHAVEAQSPLSTVLRLRHAQGGWSMTWVRATPLRYADGSVRGWIGMNLDLAEYERALASTRAAGC